MKGTPPAWRTGQCAVAAQGAARELLESAREVEGIAKAEAGAHRFEFVVAPPRATLSHRWQGTGSDNSRSSRSNCCPELTASVLSARVHIVAAT